jgi:STE24 endopeptidase
MNAYAFVVLAALVAKLLLHTVADVLNVRSLERGAPGAVRDLYSDKDYERSKRYVKAATSVELIERASLLAVVLAFWFLGGFGWLDAHVRATIDGDVLRGLLYVGSLMAGYSVFGLPFDVYRTFAVEQRFGFNRTSPATFVSDRLKGLVLIVLIGGALLAGVQLLFLHAGGAAWIWCWAMVIGFSLLTQVIAPVLILPLFNKFNPMPDGTLRDAILDYARSVRFPVENVYVIDGSRRSSRANAYFTGLGRHKRIALFDTMVDQHTVSEMVAVLAHEVGHYRRRHVVKGLLLAAAHAGVALYLLSFFLGRPGLYAAFFLSEPSVYAGLVFFTLLYTPIDAVLSMGLNVLSRRNEYEADRFALATAPEPSGLPDVLKKLAVVNLSNPNPHPFYVFVNYSHPPLGLRLSAIDEYLHSQEVSGRRRPPDESMQPLPAVRVYMWQGAP